MTQSSAVQLVQVLLDAAPKRPAAEFIKNTAWPTWLKELEAFGWERSGIYAPLGYRLALPVGGDGQIMMLIGYSKRQPTKAAVALYDRVFHLSPVGTDAYADWAGIKEVILHWMLMAGVGAYARPGRDYELARWKGCWDELAKRLKLLQDTELT